MASATHRPFAFVTTVCAPPNSTGQAEVQLAVRQRRSLLAHGCTLDTVAITHSLARAGTSRLSAAGWRVHDVSHVRLADLFTPVLEPTQERHWPRRGLVIPYNERTRKWGQPTLRPGYVDVSWRDGGCSALKLLAWGMTRYSHVLLADAGVRLLQDPESWVAAPHMVHSDPHRAPSTRMGHC